LRALARSRPAIRDACELRRAYATALGERLGVSSERFTRPGALARALRRAGVSASTAADAEVLLRQLDEAAFGQSAAIPHDALSRAVRIARAADAEAMPRHELRLPRVLGLLIAVALPLSIGALGALSVDDARQQFEAGVRAYVSRDFVAARSAFATASARAAWAPDAWANLGTSAWAAGDTATAVLGWQRALRLEPTAPDLRERLQLAQSSALGSLGFVPPASSTATLLAAIVSWCIAWVLAAALAFRRVSVWRVGLRRWAYGAGIVGVVLLLGGLDLDQRLAARDLGVLRSTAKLSSDPALGGEAKGTAVVGEVARALRREGAWTFVTLDEQREGWIESSKLISLERGAPAD
jgi:hypothetical protein